MHCAIFTIERKPRNKNKMALRSILKKTNIPKINYDDFEWESNNVASIVNGNNKEPAKTNWLEDKNKDSLDEKITGKPIQEQNEQRTVGPQDDRIADQRASPGESVLEEPSDKHADEPSEQVNESQNDSSTEQSEDSKNSFEKRGLKRKWQPTLTDGQLALKYFRFIKKQSLYLYGPGGPHQNNEF